MRALEWVRGCPEGRGASGAEKKGSVEMGRSPWGMPLKMLVPGQGASPQSSFRGAAGRGYGQEGHLRQ